MPAKRDVRVQWTHPLSNEGDQRSPVIAGHERQARAGRCAACSVRQPAANCAASRARVRLRSGVVCLLGWWVWWLSE